LAGRGIRSVRNVFGPQRQAPGDPSRSRCSGRGDKPRPAPNPATGRSIFSVIDVTNLFFAPINTGKGDVPPNEDYTICIGRCWKFGKTRRVFLTTSAHLWNHPLMTALA